MNAQHPLIGQRFGSYVVEELLGEGGMGAVYRAVQPTIGKRVAIKFLAPELAADPALVQRFFSEARAVNLIQHENIIDIFDLRSEGGQSYFVMELLAGEPLAKTLKREQRLPPPRACAIAVQVAAAIAAAHAQGIVHRDLKPDNIFRLSKAGFEDFVKVLDFGIAKLTRPGELDGPKTIRGAVLGTPGYMSPEQGTGEPVDARTDIYALGVVLYRALAGQLPFAGHSYDELLEKQLTQKAPPLTDVPAPLAQLVGQMLERKPDRRPQQMREVQSRLAAAMRDFGPIQSGRLPPVSDGWRSVPPTRHAQEEMARGRSAAHRRILRDRALVVGAALLAIATAAGAFMGMRRLLAPEPRLPAQVATRSAPATTPTTTTANAPPEAMPMMEAPGAFPIFLETTPPGADIYLDGKKVGTSPARLMLSHEGTLKLKRAGFRDEEVAVGRFTEHVIVPLHAAATRPSKPRAGHPAVEVPSGLGLND